MPDAPSDLDRRHLWHPFTQQRDWCAEDPLVIDRAEGVELIGFVNLAWDGGIHAFILDTKVHPNFRRRGVGRRMIKLAVEVARERGVEWVHADFEPHFRGFYYACGFRRTEAGVMHLSRYDENR
jgi:GNAT superfamily N-acetyltransferase